MHQRRKLAPTRAGASETQTSADADRCVRDAPARVGVYRGSVVGGVLSNLLSTRLRERSDLYS